MGRWYCRARAVQKPDAVRLPTKEGWVKKIGNEGCLGLAALALMISMLVNTPVIAQGHSSAPTAKTGTEAQFGSDADEHGEQGEHRGHGITRTKSPFS